jgi:hypothetical protein
MKSIGLPDMAFAQMEHPLGMIPLDEIRAKTDGIFPEILRLATNWKPTSLAGGAVTPPYPAPRLKFAGTYDDLNKMFYDRGWSLGMPIIPPTPERVADMLKGTKHKPDEVVWVVPPRMGQLTVELVATLGVMSGCKPEHMPLLLAIVKALSDPAYDWRGNTTTTAPTVPIVIINGPILDELGIGYSTGALGGEMPVNIAVGYFINLVGDIVGGSVPPDADKSTQGSRNDIVAIVFGENEKKNPWKQSYAVERGFKPTDNVVTAFSAYLGTNNTDHDSVTGQQILNTFAIGISGVASGITGCLADYFKPDAPDNKVRFVFLLVCPEHADTMYRDFPTKQSVKEYLIKKAAPPLWSYAPGRCIPPKDFGPYTPDTPMPRFKSPESIHIVVMGGAGKQSQIWPPFTTDGNPVSVLVQE